MASYKTKKTWKWIVIILAIVALCAIVITLGVNVYNSTRERNPDNLLEVDESYLSNKNNGYGLKVTVDDNGVINFDGQTSRNEILTVQTVTLGAGTYTISGIKDVDITDMYLAAKWGDGNIAHAGTDSATFVLEAESEVTVEIFIRGCEDGEKTISWANSTVEPVLVEGKVVGDFYS